MVADILHTKCDRIMRNMCLINNINVVLTCDATTKHNVTTFNLMHFRNKNI